MSLINRRSLIVLRWLLFAPLAFTAAALARLILIIGNRLTIARYVDPDSLLGSTWVTFISTVVYTGVLVYVSAYIAPVGKRAVSIVVATLATSAAVILFVMSVLTRDYEATFFSICFAAGACYVSWSIVRRTLEMPDEIAWDLSEHSPLEVSDVEHEGKTFHEQVVPESTPQRTLASSGKKQQSLFGDVDRTTGDRIAVHILELDNRPLSAQDHDELDQKVSNDLRRAVAWTEEWIIGEEIVIEEFEEHSDPETGDLYVFLMPREGFDELQPCPIDRWTWEQAVSKIRDVGF